MAGEHQHLLGDGAEDGVDVEALHHVVDPGEELVAPRGRDGRVVVGEEESGREWIGVDRHHVLAAVDERSDHRDSRGTAGTGDEHGAHAAPPAATSVDPAVGETTAGGGPSTTASGGIDCCGWGSRGPPMSARRVVAGPKFVTL